MNDVAESAVVGGEVTAPRRPVPADGVFATSILSATRILATFYWTRYQHYGKPLVLCDYDVGPLRGDSWRAIDERLVALVAERHSRLPHPIGLFVESELIAVQIAAHGIGSQVIPPWLTTADAWSQVLQSAAAILARGDVGYTRQASDKMDRRPFLNEAAVMAGPRPEDPVAPAFVYGVVIALDPAAARDPNPKPPRRAARN